MIDATKLQSSSEFAGFAQLKTVPTQILIPANTLVPGFAGGAVGFFADVVRPNQQSLAQVLFQVIGPTTVDSFTVTGNEWRSSAVSDYATWYQPDGANFEIRCDVLRTTTDSVRLRVSYSTLQIADLTYAPAVTVNAKVYFFRYPWE